MEEFKLKLREYAEIKNEISRLEEKIDELKPEIESIITEINPTDKTVVVENIGTFTMASKRKYIYPDYVTEKETEFKALKAEAEAKGDAQATETMYLKFTSEKID
jgi:hypothetical protein